MAVVKYKNQSEYAFYNWLGSYPESGHPLDTQRFYVFAKTVAKYRNKRWQDYAYFEKRVLTHSPHFDKENLEDFYYRLCELVKFYSIGALPTTTLDDENRRGFFQRGVRQGKRYEVQISEAEYYNGGATTQTLDNAEYF